MLGKLIRIDPKPNGGYRIPPDNPFRNRTGALPEIYAYGVRNPYRFSFDRRTGSLTIGDVGQDEIEEIDFIHGRSGGRQPRGGYNFGWDSFEGRNRYEAGPAPDHIPPVLQHTHSSGFCSITGGYVLRDRSLGRGWLGQYVYGDLCDGTLRLSRLRRPEARSHPTRMKVKTLVSFGEDGRGRVYAVSLDGPVYRIGRR
jgi:glucose/arabinose dehydrogenase